MIFRKTYAAMQADIRPDSALLQRTRALLAEHRHTRARRLRPMLVLAAVLVCLALAVPAFAMPALAADPTGYALLYRISPAAAQFFRPVNASDEDNGIRLTVESIHLADDTVSVYVALQDVTGDRLDETTDLFDSYRIGRGFDSAASCTLVDYDEATHTVRFLISITTFDGQRIEGKKLTFSLGRILSGKSEFEGALEDIDLTAASLSPATQSVGLRGLGGTAAQELFPDVFDTDRAGSGVYAMLVPTGTLAAPTPGVTVTAMGYIDGLLHIQVLYDNILETDNHGLLWLENGAEKIDCLVNASFSHENGRDSYEDYLFDVPPEQLADYTLFGYFTTCDTQIQGDWSITFPLTETE